MGCGASTPAPRREAAAPPPLDLNPPARAEAAKAKLEELKHGPAGDYSAGGAGLGDAAPGLGDAAPEAPPPPTTPAVKRMVRPNDESRAASHHRLDRPVADPAVDAGLVAKTASPAIKVAMPADHHTPKDLPDVFKYGPVVAGHAPAIEALFKKLDKDSDGFLVKAELKDVVAKYNGATFDETEFFSWYDVHGRSEEKGPDGQIDLHEFGWYLADVAFSFGSDQQAALAVSAGQRRGDPWPSRRPADDRVRRRCRWS